MTEYAALAEAVGRSCPDGDTRYSTGAQHLSMSRLALSILLASFLLLPGCDQQAALHPAEEQQVAADAVSAVSVSTLSQLAGRKSPAAVTGPIVFPEDLRPHPEADAERFDLQAVLSADNGEHLELQLRLDRLGLDRQAGAESAWNYSDVMRSSVLLAGTGDFAQRLSQSVQRRALGLADSTLESIFVTATRLDSRFLPSVSDTLPQGNGCAADFRVQATLPTGARAADSSESLSVGQSGDEANSRATRRQLELQLSLDRCPDVLELGGFRQWTARAMPVTASIQDADARQGRQAGPDEIVSTFRGHAWLGNSWGALPGSSAAVVIDTLELYLGADENTDAPDQHLTVTRSKRRSGRGPETVQGRLRNAAGAERAVDLQWIDSPGVMSGQPLPESIELNGTADGISLQLTPLRPPSAERDLDGLRWRGAVSVSGTYNGVGFVDYQPLDATGNVGQEQAE